MLQWFQQNGMKVNPEKYQALVLGNTNHHIRINCADKLIPISKDIKLLDVTLNNIKNHERFIAARRFRVIVTPVSRD